MRAISTLPKLRRKNKKIMKNENTLSESKIENGTFYTHVGDQDVKLEGIETGELRALIDSYGTWCVLDPIEDEDMVDEVFAEWINFKNGFTKPSETIPEGNY